MKNKKFYDSKPIASICIAGVLVAMIAIFNFAFEMFKIWTYSLQIFVLVYAIGIYKIKNIVVNVFFILIVPPLIFAMEKDVYAINGLQVFFEYFVAFYIFSLIMIPRYIFEFFTRKKRRKTKMNNVDQNEIFNSIIFVVSFSIIIVIKYFLHALSSLIWWGSNNVMAALIYNAPWLATNSLLIPIAIITTYPLFKLFNKFNLIQENKF